MSAVDKDMVHPQTGLGNIIEKISIAHPDKTSADLSPTPTPSARLYLSACSGEMADMVVGMEDSCVEPGKVVLV